MAKASRKSTPAPGPTGKFIDAGAIPLAINTKFEARSVVAEGSEFTKAAVKANLQRHLKDVQDATRKWQAAAEFGEFLDEAAAKCEPSAAASPAISAPAKRQVGRPGAKAWARTETQQLINDAKITPTQGGLPDFCRDVLVKLWDETRGTRPPVKWNTFRNNVRDIWNAALECTKLK